MKQATNNLFALFALMAIAAGFIGCGTEANAPPAKAKQGNTNNESASGTESSLGWTEADAYAFFDRSIEGISIAEVPAFAADDVLSVDLSESTVSEGSNPAMRIPDASHKLSICSNRLNVFQTEGQICFKGDETGDESNREYKGNLQINLTGTASKGIYISVKNSCNSCNSW